MRYKVQMVTILDNTVLQRHEYMEQTESCQRGGRRGGTDERRWRDLPKNIHMVCPEKAQPLLT